MVATLQAPQGGARAKFSLLLGLLLITMRTSAGDLPCSSMTAEQVLTGRYPDPETLIAPSACKEKARQLVQKWRQQDLADLQKLAAEACAETAAQAHWVLAKELLKLERQSILAELICGCSTEVLSEATNPPAPPTVVKVITETAPPSQNAGNNGALIPIRYTSQVLAKKAASVISRNAAELLSVISGKIITGLSPAQFDADLGGQWNNQYKTALRSLVQATDKLQTLSIQFEPQTPKTAGPVQTAATSPQIIQTLIDQTHLLSLAYDGIVRERELPWGQCYEAFAIRHQLIINSVASLVSKSSSNSTKQ